MVRIILTGTDNIRFVAETTNMDFTEAIDALGVTWHKVSPASHTKRSLDGQPYERWETPDGEIAAR